MTSDTGDDALMDIEDASRRPTGTESHNEVHNQYRIDL